MEKVKIKNDKEEKVDLKNLPLRVRLVEAKGALQFAVANIQASYNLPDELVELIISSVELDATKQVVNILSAQYMSIIHGGMSGEEAIQTPSEPSKPSAVG